MKFEKPKNYESVRDDTLSGWFEEDNPDELRWDWKHAYNAGYQDALLWVEMQQKVSESES